MKSGNVQYFNVHQGAIPTGLWNTWQGNYRAGMLGTRMNFVRPVALENTPDTEFVSSRSVLGRHDPIGSLNNVNKLSGAFKPAEQVPVSFVFFAGGKDSRFFEIEAPANVTKMLERVISTPEGSKTPLEVRARYFQRLKDAGFPVRVTVLGNQANGEKLAEALEAASSNLAATVIVQNGYPQIVPSPEDLVADTGFTARTERGLLETRGTVEAVANRICRAAINKYGGIGERIFLNDGSILRAEPGHLDVLTMYFMTQMHQDVAEGVKVAMFGAGEEIGLLYNPALIKWIQEQSLPLTFLLQTSEITQQGGGVFRYNGVDQLIDGCQIDQSKGWPKGIANQSKNLFQFGVKLDAFLSVLGFKDKKAFLALDVQERAAWIGQNLVAKMPPLSRVILNRADNDYVWGLYFSLISGQATSVLQKNFVLEAIPDKDFHPDSTHFPFAELKTRKDSKNAGALYRGYYEEFLK